MKTIFKYPLLPHLPSFMMPVGAQVLTVQTQQEKPYVWALVDPTEKASEVRSFYIYGTGHDMAGDPGKYVGTFQLEGGALVFHVFDQSTHPKD